MVGNDVVDLAEAETLRVPLHPRFDDRVFANAERRRLAASAAPERLRWMLWAAKEAAYKLTVKHTPGLGFSPRSFVTRLSSQLTGEVLHPHGRVSVRLAIDGDCIHAVASDAGSAVFCGAAGAETGECDASHAVRQLASREIARHLGVAREALAIGRRGRVPTLHVDGAPLDLSLSHHGRFLAFACQSGEPT